MIPSDKVISDAIRKAVRRLFKDPKDPDRDNLTVNNVRDQVEAELHLDAGFLKLKPWKQESKSIVKTESDILIQLEEAGEDLPSIPSTPAKSKDAPLKKPAPEAGQKGVKRSSNGDKPQRLKRRKKEATPILDELDEDSALTSIESTSENEEDSYIADAFESKKSKRSVAKPVVKDSSKQKFNKGKEKIKQDAGSARKSHALDSKPSKKSSAKLNAPGDDGKELGSDSEMSVILDEAPKRKKESDSASKGRSSTSASKSAKASKTAKTTSDLSPDEAEIKTLKSQLAMCGVRKIWGVILKDYGSDTKAKIRHLRGMLKDIGMEGRFSKQKAAEIKEARELQADLEAVKEGDAMWGMGKGARSKKISGGKKIAEASDEEEDDAAARSRSVSEKPPARLARAKMDLAFLGDESESDD